ncbi:uncharacterized protein LOC134538195 [Bacillus rossius redtenbacheri]|uniref:uncharacterized protein LOC134538195 n=1 Tax=Bacillus rossius redtenbacheri TaxID=93214 RepID=UPI002FDD89A6
MNLQLVLTLAAVSSAVALPPPRGRGAESSGDHEGHLDGAQALDDLAGAGSLDEKNPPPRRRAVSDAGTSWADQEASASDTADDLARAAAVDSSSPLLKLLKMLADLLAKLLKYKQDFFTGIGLPAYSDITSIMPELGLLGKLV